MENLIIKKCVNCGAMVEVINDCKCGNCGINCCGKQMTELRANSVDASFEKHVPNYTIKGDTIETYVNHVMENDHYIEWIAYVTPKIYTKVSFGPGEQAKATFPYIRGSKLYAFCNKHGLWQTDVE